MSTTLSSAPAKGGAAGQDGADEAPKKKSKLKLVIVLVLVLALAAGGWMFLNKGKSAKKAAPKKPDKGAVLVVDPVNINLADGHYLKLSFALQLAKKVKEQPDPSQALSIAIDQFSGQSMSTLEKPAERRKAVTKLTKAVEEAYGEDVIDLYPTTLVMQ